jgi:hypothetical protein
VNQRGTASTGELRRFGIGLGVGFALLGTILTLRGWGYSPYLFGISGLLLLLGIFLPLALARLYPLWMAGARAIGWLTTTIVLCLVFYLVFTPVALLLRLIGRDYLARRWDRDATSYWQPRERTEQTTQSYERQF